MGQNFFWFYFNFFFTLNKFLIDFINLGASLNTSRSFFTKFNIRTFSQKIKLKIKLKKINSNFLKFFFLSFKKKIVTKVFFLGSTVRINTTLLILKKKKSSSNSV